MVKTTKHKRRRQSSRQLRQLKRIQLLADRILAGVIVALVTLVIVKC